MNTSKKMHIEAVQGGKSGVCGWEKLLVLPPPLLFVPTHLDIVRLGDPVEVPRQDAHLVATQVASNQVWVRRGAIVHVTQEVVQVELSVIHAIKHMPQNLEVCSALPLLPTARVGLQLVSTLQAGVPDELTACWWHNTLGVEVLMAWVGVGWQAISCLVHVEVINLHVALSMGGGVDVALIHQGLQNVSQANPP